MKTCYVHVTYENIRSSENRKSTDISASQCPTQTFKHANNYALVRSTGSPLEAHTLTCAPVSAQWTGPPSPIIHPQCPFGPNVHQQPGWLLSQHYRYRRWVQLKSSYQWNCPTVHEHDLLWQRPRRTMLRHRPIGMTPMTSLVMATLDT